MENKIQTKFSKIKIKDNFSIDAGPLWAGGPPYMLNYIKLTEVKSFCINTETIKPQFPNQKVWIDKENDFVEFDENCEAPDWIKGRPVWD